VTHAEAIGIARGEGLEMDGSGLLRAVSLPGGAVLLVIREDLIPAFTEHEWRSLIVRLRETYWRVHRNG